ncbi:MAG: AMP-binding protein [Vicinamibacterales bacterium]
MLATLLERVPPTADAVVTPGGALDGHALRAEAHALETLVAPLRGTRVAVACLPVPQTFAALVALDRAGAQALLADEDVAGDQALLDELDVAATLIPAAEGPPRLTMRATAPAASPGRSGVVLLTSGTTGRPKPVTHSWATLATGSRGGAAERWGCGYRLRLFAACQVLVQAWSAGGCLVAGEGMSSEQAARFWATAGATAASATPSFWRWLILTATPAALAAIPLRQITMGGEPVDQPLLDRLRLAFPAARITHIYATTELGRCFAVSDGRAGFPAAWLAAGAPEGARRMTVDAGELVVHTAGSLYHTGDMVTVEGDRVQFAGRRDEVLNVGGEKVSPLAVERRLRELPEVADVLVFGRRSSVVGHLLACEVVPAPGIDPDTVRVAIERQAQAQLAPAARPRFIEVVERITLSATGKAIRGAKEN